MDFTDVGCNPDPPATPTLSETTLGGNDTASETATLGGDGTATSGNAKGRGGALPPPRPRACSGVQGHLAHKKPPSPRTLP